MRVVVQAVNHRRQRADLPEPVGPVTKTMPRGLSASS